MSKITHIFGLAELQEFCLDWQMESVSWDNLCKEFIKKKWDYQEFQKVAKANSWWLPSMSMLEPK